MKDDKEPKKLNFFEYVVKTWKDTGYYAKEGNLDLAFRISMFLINLCFVDVYNSTIGAIANYKLPRLGERPENKATAPSPANDSRQPQIHSSSTTTPSPQTAPSSQTTPSVKKHENQISL